LAPVSKEQTLRKTEIPKVFLADLLQFRGAARHSGLQPLTDFTDIGVCFREWIFPTAAIRATAANDR
jgi:hypothetical protein